ncbi:MAG: four helix bundle protein [Longimicrobiales bacterium]
MHHPSRVTIGRRGYKDLRVWQEAFALAELCYDATDVFPRSEMFSLAAQVRRAAISVPANVAEGAQRRGRGEFIFHVSVALGSIGELETLIMLARSRDYIPAEAAEGLLDRCGRVGRMLKQLERSLVRRRKQERAHMAAPPRGGTRRSRPRP